MYATIVAGWPPSAPLTYLTTFCQVAGRTLGRPESVPLVPGRATLLYVDAVYSRMTSMPWPAASAATDSASEMCPPVWLSTGPTMTTARGAAGAPSARAGVAAAPDQPVATSARSAAAMRAGRVRRPVGSANALPPVHPVIAGRPWARQLRREGQGGPSTHRRLCRDGPAPHGPMGPRGYGSMATSPHRNARWEGHVSQEPADPTASSAPPDGTPPTIPPEGADVQPEPVTEEAGTPDLAASGPPEAEPTEPAAASEAPAEPATTTAETSAAILAAVAASETTTRTGRGSGTSGRGTGRRGTARRGRGGRGTG